jgi:hypothetical protein
MTVSAAEWSTSGRWDLPIVGFEVSHMTFGALQVDIVAYGEAGGRSESGRPIGAPNAVMRFEGAFEFNQPDHDPIRLDPSVQDWEDLTPIFTLRHDRVDSAVATASDAQLDIEFASGRRILAGPDPHYENWEISGPGFRVISRPGGGGVAYFREETA